MKKKLTKRERFALAREARRLAMECAEEAAPYIGQGSGFTFEGRPVCALGHVYARAFPARAEEMYISSGLQEMEEEIVYASDHFPDSTRQRALVFPLLALADALEASNASAEGAP